MKKIISFVGGPGAGKSTSAAALFSLMKLRGFKVELVHEVAKFMVYKQDLWSLGNQLSVTARQYELFKSVSEHVDFIITDTALELGKLYSADVKIHTIIDLLNADFKNIYVFVKRAKPYVSFGRTQTESEALALDARIREQIPADFEIYGDAEGPQLLLESLLASEQLI